MTLNRKERFINTSERSRLQCFRTHDYRSRGAGILVGMAHAGKIRKMSINVSAPLGRRVRELAYHAGVSESSIVETALLKLIDRKSDLALAKQLKRAGATLRRPNFE